MIFGRLSEASEVYKRTHNNFARFVRKSFRDRLDKFHNCFFPHDYNSIPKFPKLPGQVQIIGMKSSETQKSSLPHTPDVGVTAAKGIKRTIACLRGIHCIEGALLVWLAAKLILDRRSGSTNRGWWEENRPDTQLAERPEAIRSSIKFPLH